MSSPQDKLITSEVPLCVDLDGSFVKTDLLFEATLRLLKTQPWLIFHLVLWTLAGKANLKAQIAKRVDISTLPLPVNAELLAYLEAESAERAVILVTGSNQRFADAIVERYPVFTEAFGSNDQTNLTGQYKTDFLIDRYGLSGFDYVGNDTPDRVVWESARQSYFAGFDADQSKFANVEFDRVFLNKSAGVKGIFGMIRVHQWSKNLLVLVPLFLDQQLGHFLPFVSAMLGFLAFSLLASATYIINDLLDLPADRLNTTKQHRPLASGAISINKGLLVCAFLFLAAGFIALFLPASFAVVLGVYLVLTLLYSFVLKSAVILDVIIIAVLHTIRIIGGTLVIGAEDSFWLLAFSLFIFTSFALAKRVSELTNLKMENRQDASGRGYTVTDLPLLTSAGMGAGYVSVLVIALYINSDKVLENYHRPEILWILCPGFLYWIGRLWLMTSRGQMHEDPIVYILKDKVSLFTLLCFLIVVSVGFVL